MLSMDAVEWVVIGIGLIAGVLATLYTLLQIRREGAARRAVVTSLVVLLLFMINGLVLVWPFSNSHARSTIVIIVLIIDVALLVVPGSWYLKSSYALGDFGEPHSPQSQEANTSGAGRGRD